VTLLSKSYRRFSRGLISKLRGLRKNPTADNVHDLRTSIRRWEAVVDLFPKKIRKRRKMKKYLAVTRQLFRSTTPIRDLDVVAQNIASGSGDRNVSVLSLIGRDRSSLLPTVLHFADLLLELKAPEIRRKDLSSRAISRRRDRIVGKLVAKLQEEVPVVMTDYRKIKELHDVRKECKKLRYTLEQFPSDYDDNLGDLMRAWQSTLGTIRDIDVTQRFAEERGLTEELEDVLTKLRIFRDRLMGSFNSTAKLEKRTIPAGI
jgi:CHAD domain-containing protein